MSRRSDSTSSPLWKIPVDEEVREELEFHLEMRSRELQAAGLSAEEARQKALERFGDTSELEAECRQLAHGRDRRFRALELLQELRYDAGFAVRQLRQRPGFALTVVGILAVGLAVNIAGFSLLHDALLEPPPFREPARLVTIWEAQPQRGALKNVVGPANLLEWREQNTSFERIAGFVTMTANVNGGGEPLRAQMRLVTDGFFEILGRSAALGRTLTDEDGQDGGSSAVVLSHGFWSTRFGGSADVLGSSMDVDGRAAEIVGVLPQDFELDMGPQLRPYGDDPDFYAVLPVDEKWRGARGRWLLSVARLRDQVTVEQAGAEMTAIAARLEEKYPSFDADWTARVVPLQEHLGDAARSSVLALFGAVALVLLIVCVNVASLLIARTSSRSGELAVRSALGADRGRLLRQLMVESGVLTAVAAGLGLLLALALLRLLRTVLPAELVPTQGGSLPVSALLFGIALALLCTVLLGLLPALFASRRSGAILHTRSADGRRRQRLRTTLVFAEVALAVILLVGAGLMLQTVRRLLAVDPGFDREGVVSFAVALPRGTDTPEQFAFFDQLLERLQSAPGVQAAGAVSHIPIASAGAVTSYFPTDRPEPDPGSAPSADIRVLRGDYLQTMGIPLLEGRGLDSRDGADDEVGAVLVNRTLAEREWPDESPIGKQVSVFWGEPGVRQIVGVVGAVALKGLDQTPRNAIYFPHQQEPEGAMTVVLRTETAMPAVVEAAKVAVAELRPELPIYDVRTLQSVVGESLSRQRFLSGALTAFAAISLLLSALGIYSVMAFAVAQRRRELGLRMALGASPGSAAALVLSQASRLTVAGLAVGVAGALVLGRWVESLLFGVRPADPAVLAIVVVVFAATALLASLLPARRAARVAPMQVLREE